MKKALELLETLGELECSFSDYVDDNKGTVNFKGTLKHSYHYKTIKQALQNNVSEYKKDEIDELLENAKGWIDKANGGRMPQYKQVYLEKAKREINKVLLPLYSPHRFYPQPSIEELKQSIIDRLNEYAMEDQKFKFDELLGCVRLKSEYEIIATYKDGRCRILVELPLDLARDIITLFKLLKESE